jgi:hypothetical protein
MNDIDRDTIKEYDYAMAQLHGLILPYSDRQSLITSIQILQKFLVMSDEEKLERANKFFYDPNPF